MINDFGILAVVLESGEVMAELPELQLGKIGMRLGDSYDTTATLPWDKIPKNWREATLPFHTAIVFTQNTVPIWGGIIVKRERKSGSNGVELTLVTFEHYLDRVYITDHSFNQMPQTEIAKNLLNDIAGHRINYGYDITPSNIKRDRNYTADQDKTIFSALQELSGVIEGCEWYVDWRIENDGTYCPYFVCADHVGSTKVSTTFDISVMTDFSYLEDYTSGYGANAVKAVSPADGSVRPESTWHRLDDPYRPIIEDKIQPSTSITQIDTLEAHAEAELQQLQNGTNTFSVTIAMSVAPKINIDWRLGDEVSFQLGALSDVMIPEFTSVEARIVGFDIDTSGSGTITPIIQ
jgi:hypothetical protein